MLDALWSRVPPPRRRPHRRLGPSEESLQAEAELTKRQAQAMDANNRISMGAVLTAGRAMAAESSVRAMLGGMLAEIDRGKDRDDRA
ncbi:hypothetical protein [Methylobacterium trifolii]|uniref:Uncharacterized protein n=1 Tax=Methylobacterium trifolii TaxID=1003092 RepID=A0ABQ4U777_9HYPH|nr:hypothetical protein [Methylobacterium trifolii]GJE61685.1 hypothetical protein MPOCJGCO_3808 [Methylobacterium trifolii]